MNCGRYLFCLGQAEAAKRKKPFAEKKTAKMILIVNVEVQVRKRVHDNYSFLHVQKTV
jgi:hypothetical protein